jgi:hypothetical protein
MERNQFDLALRKLAMEYAPEQISKVGDIVTAEMGGWKSPHKVKITSVAVEISDINLTIGQRSEMGLTGWLIVQHEYCGRRINQKGDIIGSTQCSFLLNKFTTLNGVQYKRLPSSFNHVGLVFDLEDNHAD